MTEKTPDPEESGPSSAASSTSSVPIQPKPATGDQSAPAEPTTITPATSAVASGAPAAATAPPTPTAPTKAAVKPPGSPPRPPVARPALPPRPRRGGSGLAAAVAVCAVLVAVGSIAVAVYALDVAREAKSAAAGSATAGPSDAASAPAATATPTAAPSATVAPPAFQPEFVRSEVNIPASNGCASVFVDVDAMQVGTFAGHEFYLSSCLGPQSIRIDRTSGAVPTSENPTPELCAAQLAGTATTTELVLQARAGLTFCLLTNKDDAISQGIPQRIGIVEIREVRADRSMVVAVSTYRLPGQTS